MDLEKRTAMGSTDECYFKQKLGMENTIYFPLSSLKGESDIKACTKVVADVTSTKEPIFSTGTFKKGNLCKKHLTAQIMKAPLSMMIHPHYVLYKHCMEFISPNLKHLQCRHLALN